MNMVLKKVFLILAGVVVALTIAEAVAWFMLPKANPGLSMPMAEGTLAQFYFDEELGYFPKVGEGGEYGPYGCLANDYRADDRGQKKRVLFIGDSVTHRGEIIEALKQLYGEADFEYWNAGVESFNTAQILELYRRHNKGLEPDHVVLTFHNNDFQLTPVAKEENGEVVLYIPSQEPVEAPLPVLGRTSLYKLWLQLGSAEYERKPNDVKRDLAEIKRLVEEHGGQFSVLVFPILKPMEEWNEREKRSRKNALRILEELNLRSFDLLKALPEKKSEYQRLRQDPEDTWHPSSEGGMVMGRFLYEAELFSDSQSEDS